MGKSCKLPFMARNFNAQQPLDLLHLDLWGPSLVMSNAGYRFYLSIVHDCTRYVWLYPLVRKSDTLYVFMMFKKMVENLLSRTIKIIQSDGGGEFMSKAFTTFLQHHGIIHQISCPYTPQQNGVVERKHRHIVEMGLCLLSQSSLPLSFWLETFSTAVFLINRLPMAQLQHVSPYEKLLHRLLIIDFSRSLVAPAFLIWYPIIDTSCCLSLLNVCFLAMTVITKGIVAWIFLPAEYTSLGMLLLTSHKAQAVSRSSQCLHLHGLGQLLYNLCPPLQTHQYLQL
jgi:hypothetical protein